MEPEPHRLRIRKKIFFLNYKKRVSCIELKENTVNL
jgi:hypothetical protein